MSLREQTVQRHAFSQNASGRLVRTLDGRHLAFVPDPLPPKLDLDRETQEVLAAASDALGELRGVGRMLANPGLVISPFARREAVLSSRIEGTTAGIADLVLYEATSEIPPERPDDVREVANYLAALQYSFELLREMPVCNRLIRTVHARLLDGDRGQERRPGEFRQYQNAIGILGTGAEGVRFIPPPVKEMNEAMALLEAYIGARYASPPLLVQLALIHYQFETIHPFMDGNGRMGRLLIPVLLHERGHLTQPLLYLSAYFDRHKESCKDHLLSVSQDGTWDDWTRFFLVGVIEQSQEAISIADRLLSLQSTYRDLVARPRSSANALRFVDYLFESPAVTARSVSERLSVTPVAAYKLIDKLVSLDILREVTGRSYSRVFIAEAIVSATLPDREPV